MRENIYPKLLEETIIKEQDDKVLFLVPSKPDWIVTNKNGAVALSLCNGQNSLDDIKAILAEHPKAVEAIELIKKLQGNGFFESSPNKYIKHSLFLSSVHLNISSSCNLQCNYCYAEERQNQIGQPLSLHEYQHLIDDLANINKNIEVAITGGEPLLNSDACEISDYCRSKGFYTHLLTNATTIDESNFEKIATSFDEIRVSLDGYMADTHDYHRGIGSFEKIIKAISLLEEAGARIRVAMTVTKQNIGDIELMAGRYGNKLIFQPLFNAGNAKGSDMTISGEEYFYALKNAKGVEPYAQIGSTLMRLKNRGIVKCAIGGEEISISDNGDVYPCHMLHLPEYFAGNVRECPIAEIYKNSMALSQIRKLSVQSREDCKECPVRLLCGGSCRARAFYLTGDLDAADSFCDYEFLAFTEGLLSSVDITASDSICCVNCGCSPNICT